MATKTAQRRAGFHGEKRKKDLVALKRWMYFFLNRFVITRNVYSEKQREFQMVDSAGLVSFTSCRSMTNDDVACEEKCQGSAAKISQPLHDEKHESNFEAGVNITECISLC